MICIALTYLTMQTGAVYYSIIYIVSQTLQNIFRQAFKDGSRNVGADSKELTPRSSG